MSQPGRHARDEVTWAPRLTTRTGRRLAPPHGTWTSCARAASTLPSGRGRKFSSSQARPKDPAPLPAAARSATREAACGAKLAKRTLTGLYNERPAWLALGHEKLDAAVAAAYRFDDVKDEE